MRTPLNPRSELERMDRDLASASAGTVHSELDLEGRELWEQVLDVLGAGVTIHSADGRVLAANRQALELAGREAEELLGHLLLRDATRADSAVRTRLYPLKNHQGEIAGYVQVIESGATGRQTQGDALRAEYVATLGQMISGIAHDLGTPLNIISGYAEYLMMKIGPGAVGQKELAAIIQQTRRVADFVQQMLDLARPAPAGSQAVGWQEFLERLLDLLGSHVRKLGVGVALSCGANAPLFYGDGGRLRQALFSLALNGARAVGSGGELEIVVAEPAPATDDLLIVLQGKKPSGEAASFSDLLVQFDPSADGAGSPLPGLLLAREVLRDFGARVAALPVGEQGVGLAIYLPRGGGTKR